MAIRLKMSFENELLHMIAEFLTTVLQFGLAIKNNFLSPFLLRHASFLGSKTLFLILRTNCIRIRNSSGSIFALFVITIGNSKCPDKVAYPTTESLRIQIYMFGT